MSVSETLIADVRAHAAHVEHPWDARALDWPLTSDSVVVEVGGYTGRWALQIAERYAPRLYVFEPQPWAYAVCKEVLGERAIVKDYALGTQSAELLMGGWDTDGCSFVKPGGEHTGWMLEMRTVFTALDITHIDLMLMNIEGYEYTLLPYMLGQGILPDRLMAQFHPPTPDGVETGQIYARLADAHYTVAWTYGIVLTAWERI